MISSGSSTNHNNNNNNQSPLDDYNAKMMHSLSHSLIGSSASSHLIGSQHHLTSPLNGVNAMTSIGGYQPSQTTPPSQFTPQNLMTTSSGGLLKLESPPHHSNPTPAEAAMSSSPSGVTPHSHSQMNTSATGSTSSNHNTPSGSVSLQQQQGDISTPSVGVAGSNTPLTTGGSSLGVTDHQQFENDKKVIFKLVSSVKAFSNEFFAAVDLIRFMFCLFICLLIASCNSEK